MRYYRCNIDGILYPETDLIIDKDIGLICKNCAVSMKKLDTEQEEAEMLHREEMKMKAGLFEEEL